MSGKACWIWGILATSGMVSGCVTNPSQTKSGSQEWREFCHALHADVEDHAYWGIVPSKASAPLSFHLFSNSVHVRLRLREEWESLSGPERTVAAYYMCLETSRLIPSTESRLLRDYLVTRVSASKSGAEVANSIFFLGQLGDHAAVTSIVHKFDDERTVSIGGHEEAISTLALAAFQDITGKDPLAVDLDRDKMSRTEYLKMLQQHWVETLR